MSKSGRRRANKRALAAERKMIATGNSSDANAWSNNDSASADSTTTTPPTSSTTPAPSTADDISQPAPRYFAAVKCKPSIPPEPGRPPPRVLHPGEQLPLPRPDAASLTNFAYDRELGEMVFGPIPDREYHEGFMRQAIAMANAALACDETPVGCVFVRDGEVIGRGINGTNASLNGTRHAEFVALCEIMSRHHPSVLHTTDLYVTVEPCVMCASALRQFGIRAVYFGCLNDRFGGTGGVMTVNADEGVEPGYPVYGGLFREEAIMLLRRFYVQENDKAPEPKPKKNRELKTAILPVGVPTGANSIYGALAGQSHANASATPTTPMETPPAVATPVNETPAAAAVVNDAPAAG